MSLSTLSLLALLAAAPSPTSEAATAFLEALRQGDLAAAQARLGPRMKAAVSAQVLREAWGQAAAGLGAFQRLELLEAGVQQGFATQRHAARYAQGGLELTTAVDPATLAVEGFFVKPLPGGAAGPDAEAPAAPPEHLTEVEVVVGSAPFELGGTLTLPEGKGPFPAAVLVHGSGPSDRDETVGRSKPFLDLARGLAAKGVAVLRYDKRTLTHGKAYQGKAITFDEETVDDAVLALALVRGRPEVDPRRVYVVGHSLGALLAPRIAARDGQVAGAVLLAPPARKPWDLIPQQLQYLEVPPAKVAEARRALLAARDGRDAGTVLGAPAAYWRQWGATDGVAEARALKVPVLVLRGSRDYQVTAEDLAAYREGLKRVKTAQVVELKGLNHFFRAGEGRSTPAEYQAPGHVAPQLVERLAAFLR